MLPVSEKKRLVSKHCFIPLQGEKGKVQYKGGRGVERKVQHNMALLGFVCLVSSVKRQTNNLQVVQQLSHAVWTINIHLRTLFHEEGSWGDAKIEMVSTAGGPGECPSQLQREGWSAASSYLITSRQTQSRKVLLEERRLRKQHCRPVSETREGMPGCSGQSGKSIASPARQCWLRKQV